MAATPTEFRYTDHQARDSFLWRLGVAGVVFLASIVSGLWGISALAHASWLEDSDLPGHRSTVFGLVMLGIATVQGLTSILVVFGTRLGQVLGILLAMIAIGINIWVFSAWPVASAISIGLQVFLISILVVHGHKH